MKIYEDLLILARTLVADEERAGQAHLRRAVSAAYYALFHMLADDATRRMFGTQDDRAALRSCLARAFEHSTMAKAAKSFAVPGAPQNHWHRRALDDSEIQPEIVKVAKTFIVLQNARHKADYDLSESVTPGWAQEMVSQAEEAFTKWNKVRNTLQADVFLAGMLVGNNTRAGAGK